MKNKFFALITLILSIFCLGGCALIEEGSHSLSEGKSNKIYEISIINEAGDKIINEKTKSYEIEEELKADTDFIVFNDLNGKYHEISINPACTLNIQEVKK